MEPTMSIRKLLMTTAAVAVLMPLLAPTTSFAGGPGRGGVGGGRGGVSAPAIAAGPRGVANVAAGAIAAGGGWRGGGVPTGGAVAVGNGGWRGGGVAVGNGGGGWNGGGWHGGWHDHDHDRHHGFFPGAIAGAVIGGAIASNAYGYYGGPDYYYGQTYDDSYYDNGYVDNGAVTDAPGEVGVDANYCAQRYRTYDPGSGTYLGYDGLRHPCP
jgi:hypothetical protein